jgi:WG repeat protein
MKTMKNTAALIFALAVAMPATAEETSYNDWALFPIQVKEKYGAINRSGEVVIPPEYEEPIVMREGLARVRKGSRVAYLDASGKRVIEPQEMTSELFSQGVAPATGRTADGKFGWGYIDRKGAWRIQPQFADAKGFSGSRAAVGVADEWGKVKYGYIDANGAIVIKPQFDKAFAFGRVARVEIEKRIRLIDSQGRDVTPADIDAFAEVSDGMMLARKGRLLGFLDDEGKVAIAPRFQSVQDFKGGRARFWENSKYGYIDKKGNVVIEAKFDSAADFSEGLAAVRVGERYGFVDPNGRLVIEPAFERVQDFSDGVAAAQLNKLWGYIGKDGKWKIEPKYAWVRPFKNGLAWAGEPKMRGGNYVDHAGRVVWKSPPE